MARLPDGPFARWPVARWPVVRCPLSVVRADYNICNLLARQTVEIVEGRQNGADPMEIEG